MEILDLFGATLPSSNRSHCSRILCCEPMWRFKLSFLEELFSCQTKDLMSPQHQQSLSDDEHCWAQSPLRHLGHTWVFMTAQPGLLLQKTPNQPFIKSMASTLGCGTQQLSQQSCSFNTFMLHHHRWWLFPTICQHWQQIVIPLFFPFPEVFSMIDFVSYTAAKQWNQLSHLQQPFGSAENWVLTQLNPTLQKFNEFLVNSTEARNSWGKTPHHYNVLLICASPIPGLEFLPENVLWHFLSSQFNHCWCDCASVSPSV